MSLSSWECGCRIEYCSHRSSCKKFANTYNQYTTAYSTILIQSTSREESCGDGSDPDGCLLHAVELRFNGWLYTSSRKPPSRPQARHTYSTSHTSPLFRTYPSPHSPHRPHTYPHFFAALIFFTSHTSIEQGLPAVSTTATPTISPQ